MKKIFIGLCFLMVPFTTVSNAQSCITAECHKDFKNFKVLHTPARDDCLNCHTKKGDHKFELAEDTGTCLLCHDDKMEGKNVHEALNSVPCQECHNPHGGRDKALLKSPRQDTQCFECHDKEAMTRKVVHGPMASGNCSICHNPHASSNPSLLKTGKERVCTQCHTDKDYSGSDIKPHTALNDGCTGCHDAHSSANPYQLRSPVENLCALCHSDMVKKAGTVKFKHPVIQQDKKCANCHDPHGSMYDHSLRTDPLNLCLNCHDKPIIGTDGKDYNITRIVRNNPEKHGPVADGNCAGCHNPHGSDSYKMLIDDFPEEFYTPFQEAKYNLCFECHDNSIVRDEKTTTLTNFRDGDRNLHYLHVNREKGRTCRACHEIHAGDLPNHIRHETPFGKWDIPIEFEKTDNGGSCTPGCHKAYSYARTARER